MPPRRETPLTVALLVAAAWQGHCDWEQSAKALDAAVATALVLWDWEPADAEEVHCSMVLPATGASYKKAAIIRASKVSAGLHVPRIVPSVIGTGMLDYYLAIVERVWDAMYSLFSACVVPEAAAGSCLGHLPIFQLCISYPFTTSKKRAID